ncbi:MAG: sigma-70 family RNA polymerase sigma factor [Bacteroidota bacterium]
MPVQLDHTELSISKEEHILSLLKKKDKNGLQMVFDNYAVNLLNVILRIVKDKTLAEDVLQEALLKIWDNANGYHRSKGSLFTWFVTICRNTAIDKTRTKDFRLVRESRMSPELVTVEKENEDNELEKLYMKQLIDQLPSNLRNLIDLAYFQGYTQKEIANNLDMPLGTVKTRIRRALSSLRSII